MTSYTWNICSQVHTQESWISEWWVHIHPVLKKVRAHNLPHWFSQKGRWGRQKMNHLHRCRCRTAHLARMNSEVVSWQSLPTQLGFVLVDTFVAKLTRPFHRSTGFLWSTTVSFPLISRPSNSPSMLTSFHRIAFEWSILWLTWKKIEVPYIYSLLWRCVCFPVLTRCRLTAQDVLAPCGTSNCFSVDLKLWGSKEHTAVLKNQKFWITRKVAFCLPETLLVVHGNELGMVKIKTNQTFSSTVGLGTTS